MLVPGIDDTAKQVALPCIGLHPVGIVTVAAGNGTTTVRMRLDGAATEAAQANPTPSSTDSLNRFALNAKRSSPSVASEPFGDGLQLELHSCCRHPMRVDYLRKAQRADADLYRGPQREI